MAARRIGIVVRKSLHENFFQLIKSVFANHELIKIDVNAGDRGTCFHSFYSVSSFKVALGFRKMRSSEKIGILQTGLILQVA